MTIEVARASARRRRAGGAVVVDKTGSKRPARYIDLLNRITQQCSRDRVGQGVRMSKVHRFCHGRSGEQGGGAKRSKTRGR